MGWGWGWDSPSVVTPLICSLAPLSLARPHGCWMLFAEPLPPCWVCPWVSSNHQAGSKVPEVLGVGRHLSHLVAKCQSEGTESHKLQGRLAWGQALTCQSA